MTDLLEMASMQTDTDDFGSLRGQSPVMHKLYRSIQRVAPTRVTVLLAGETGTGKEVVARTIHDLSDSREGAFVAMNCGAISANLVESEIFGHDKGSFTGASRQHNGVFSQADGGTLFLDEITEMPVDLQVKLLRVLETGRFARIGAEKTTQTRARIVAATNVDPETAVREGKLRQDLFYRLSAFPISLPPLRERDADVELLARHFLSVLNQQNGTEKSFAADVLRRLRAHSWPGNVRELKHSVQHAFILADDLLQADDLLAQDRPVGELRQITLEVGSSIATAEKQLILATMDSCLGQKPQAALILGISLKTLYCRLNLYAAQTRPSVRPARVMTCVT